MRKTSSLPNSGADSTDFPFGLIIYHSVNASGTPVIEATYSDFIQNLWHFIASAEITPNGLQDNVTNGFQLAKALQVVLDPVGSTKEWPVASLFPPGYVLEDGRSISKTIYPDLFALIGYNYGGSDDNFNIPNSVDKFIVGAGDLYNAGSIGGEANHLLTANETPPHVHKVQHAVGGGNQNKGATGQSGLNTTPVFEDLIITDSGAVSQGGTLGGAEHNNMPPYIAKSRIIKIQYV